jgi:acetoin utilization deacetylase AcuC-like enzyme
VLRAALLLLVLAPAAALAQPQEGLVPPTLDGRALTHRDVGRLLASTPGESPTFDEYLGKFAFFYQPDFDAILAPEPPLPEAPPRGPIQFADAIKESLKVFYSDDYTLSSAAFETTRKSRWIAESLADRPIPGLSLVHPRPAIEAELTEVHHPAYVSAIRTGTPRALASSQEFKWDRAFWDMVLASNGGAIDAALTAMREGIAGSLSSGLHHARAWMGNGFCTFNGLVLAARAALKAGARNVLIIDLDAHHGGGTHSLVADDPRIHHLDVSVDRFDSYVPEGENTLDYVAPGRNQANRYMNAIRTRLDEIRRSGKRFDLVIYNAGMDPFEDVRIGGRKGITRELLAERERLVFDFAVDLGMPISFVMAGGYLGPRLDEKGLVDLHRLTLEAAHKALERLKGFEAGTPATPADVATSGAVTAGTTGAIGALERGFQRDAASAPGKVLTGRLDRGATREVEER